MHYLIDFGPQKFRNKKGHFGGEVDACTGLYLPYRRLVQGDASLSFRDRMSEIGSALV